MSKGAKTLYYENNLILITTEAPKHVYINVNLFDFSYELEPNNFYGSPALQAKFVELHQSEKEKVKTQIKPGKSISPLTQEDKEYKKQKQ